jgi:amino acid adenylation domain-containing protein/thioester reductase-like protein
MRMWFHHILRPLDTAYNVVAILNFDRALDRGTLERAIKSLVNQNSILRTGFRLSGSAPIAYQQSAENLVCDIRWAERPAGDTDSIDFIQHRSDLADRHTFDLASGRPPVWFELIGRNSEVDGIIICQHHIITDGWSIERLYRQLSRLYTASVTNQSLPDAPVGRFEDYARESARQNHTTEIAYWRDVLTGTPTLNLPFSRTRPNEQTFRGKSIYGSFDTDTEEALHAYARKAQTTIFTLQLSMVGALLGRLAEQFDFVIGTPHANRREDIYHDVLGLFVNSIGLRQNLAGDPDLITLVERARRTLSEGLDHADAPIEKVVEALELPSAVSHNPLFQVLVANQSWASEAPEFHGIPSRHILARSSSTRFDLEWTFFPRELKRGFRLTWNTDIIADEHAAKLRDLLIRITRQWLLAPATRLSELELVPISDVPALIRHNPRPLKRNHMSIADAFADQANATPDRIAVSSSQTRYTYRQVERAAGRLADALAAAAGGRRIVVATLIDREPLLLVAILAVFKAGCALVPLDPQQPASRSHSMIEDGKVAYVIVNGKTLLLSEIDCHVGTIDIADLLADRTPNILGFSSNYEHDLPNDTAYVLYTSGTTGIPKGVVIRHTNVMNTLLGAGEAFAFNADDVFAVFAPVGFDIFFFELFSALLVGGEAHLVTREDWLDGEKLQRVFDRATCLQAVPGLMTSILDQIEPQGPQRAMRQVTTGGDRVPPCLLDRIRRSFPNAEVSVTYGPTETAILATRHVVTDSVEDYPIGHPLPNVNLLIADEFGRVVPNGVEGELWIGGAGVAWGYLNRPEENKDRFVSAFGDRFYRTGDRCQWSLDGILQFRGRRDNQAKIRGFRVELGEIEAKMAEHPCVRSAVATTLSIGGGDAKLLAYYVRDPELPLSNDQHTDEWCQIFDFIHDSNETKFAGWHDSVEGKPLAEDEMTSWHEATLSRLSEIINRRPKSAPGPRILEIGCGTGLVLLNLAPRCTRYDATDISPVLVERLRRECEIKGLTECDIVISQASEACFFDRDYDIVILNSVVQYFPNSTYLTRAIRNAWERVADGGVLFLGDMRALNLHDPFLYEIAAKKAKLFGSSPTGELLRLRAQENELLVNPSALALLAQDLPGFGGIHTSPKFEGIPNEVTRFRFDATIRRAKRPSVAPVSWEHNKTWTLEQIEALAKRSIAEKQWIGVTALPNSWITGSTRSDEVNPASVVRTAQTAGADCSLSWRSARPNGAFDAVFGLALHEPCAIDFPESEVDSEPLTNTPASRKVLATEVSSIRTHLMACLPTYLTPAQITPISELPLTSHDKVDRAALPVSQTIYGKRDNEPPRTAIEKQVSLIWQEILGLSETPGRSDSFFHLGGTSLSAIRLATRLRADGFSLRPQVIFTHQTVAELSSVLSTIEKVTHQAHSSSTDYIEKARAEQAFQNVTHQATWPTFTPGTRIMLTGATGFLGIHLLRELIYKEGVEILCPVRANDTLSVWDRLASAYRWYFGEELRLVAGNRVTAFPADLTNGSLTWSASPLPFPPDMIIHSAADVRHLASADAVNRANVNGTEAVLSLAQVHDAPVHHISSVGVAGVWIHENSPPILRETDLDVGQTLTEPYSESKFEAERLVRGFQHAGGKAIVYRSSTIAPHSRSGRFQQRFDAHFLTRQIKACIALGAAPERKGKTLSLVPVDIMANWIIELAGSATSNETYHLEAQLGLSYRAFYELIQSVGYNITILSDQAFKSRLFEAMSDPKLQDVVGVFIKIANGEEGLAVPLDSTLTFARLAELGSKSVEIDQSWVQAFVSDSVERGCLTAPSL